MTPGSNDSPHLHGYKVGYETVAVSEMIEFRNLAEIGRLYVQVERDGAAWWAKFQQDTESPEATIAADAICQMRARLRKLVDAYIATDAIKIDQLPKEEINT